MEKIVSIMTELLKKEIFPKEESVRELFEKESEGLSREEAEKLYTLSKAHDLAHLVGDAVIKRNLVRDETIKAQFHKQLLLSFYRSEKITEELKRVRTVLNEEKIPFLPLKGAVIRDRYPEAWMRTSCDLDILLKKEDIRRAFSLLLEKTDGKEVLYTHHDVSFLTSDGVRLELHHALIEEGRIGTAEKLLSDIWEYAKPKENSFEYVLSEEMFYYYHLAHMAKHIEGGGCGVRPFLDLRILGKIEQDEEKRKTLLKKGGLVPFAEVAEELANGWFGDGVLSETAQKLGQYILRSGSYGNNENHSAVKQAQGKGKGRYIFGRIFLPYADMVLQYPALAKRKFMLPFYEIRRWCRLFNPAQFRKNKKELSMIRNQSEKDVTDVRILLKELSLL